MLDVDSSQLTLFLVVLGIGSVLCLAPMMAYFFINRDSTKQPK